MKFQLFLKGQKVLNGLDDRVAGGDEPGDREVGEVIAEPGLVGVGPGGLEGGGSPTGVVETDPTELAVGGLGVD